jgi:hypothetical protein
MPVAVSKLIVEHLVRARSRLTPGDVVVQGPLHVWAVEMAQGVFLGAKVVGVPNRYVAMSPDGSVSMCSEAPFIGQFVRQSPAPSRFEAMGTIHVAQTGSSDDLTEHLWPHRRWTLCKTAFLVAVTLGLTLPWLAAPLFISSVR